MNPPEGTSHGQANKGQYVSDNFDLRRQTARTFLAGTHHTASLEPHWLIPLLGTEVE